MTVASVAGPAVLVEAPFTRRATVIPNDTSRLDVNAPGITEALRELGAARSAYRRAMGANHMGRRGAAARLEAAEHAKDLALANLERAVRIANPHADGPAIAAATHRLVP
jgi:hypothetical protein